MALEELVAEFDSLDGLGDCGGKGSAPSFGNTGATVLPGSSSVKVAAATLTTADKDDEDFDAELDGLLADLNKETGHAAAPATTVSTTWSSSAAPLRSSQNTTTWPPTSNTRWAPAATTTTTTSTALEPGPPSKQLARFQSVTMQSPISGLVHEFENDFDFDFDSPTKAPTHQRASSMPAPVPAVGAGGANAAAGPGFAKCTTLYIGGSGFRRGLGSGMLKKVCARLRCTACDFEVLRLDDLAAGEDVDYLFLRNAMPSAEKLATRMTPAPGAATYCCQCSHRSVEAFTAITFESELRWTCAGHAS
uniref:Cilia- and flagella-associated protein 418 n=1 Tax=Phaeomonas parva TaxID=124430 RepID=A0A7S1XV23_9STRA|mmetsp:Transcript_35965/g.113015  ORF Transcript_35965/g.113015 Transcript_35965/m.113015 type:complete len:306 (+) Transcript_35965:381-1298(+)